MAGSPIRLALLLFVAAGLLAAPARTEEERVTAQGPHFRVICHFASERAAKEALATAEALWEQAALFYGLGTRGPSRTLELHLYRDADAYVEAEAELTKGAFQRNLAFAHYKTRSAHVALQPEVSDDLLATDGLPLLTHNLIAHEAAHLVRFDTMPNFEDHPGWFGDGAAQFLKYETLLAEKHIDGLLADPMSAKAFLRVQGLLKANTLSSVDALLRDQIADLEFYDAYAAKRLLFTFLATGDRRPNLDAVREALRRMGGGSGYRERARAQVEKAFGARYETLDEEWRLWIRAERPVWDEVIRSLDAQGTAWHQTAFRSSNAVAWRTERCGSPQLTGERAYTLRGRLEILPSYGKQMNLLLARGEEGFVSIAFTAGYGINVFDYRSAAGGTWTSLASVRCAEVVQGSPVAFEVRVQKRTLTVSVAGTILTSVEIPAAHEADGPYGVGAQRGTAGIWHDVTLVR
jgi:hypothetical protein